VLPWPAVSSDLSPIEHVWNEMERWLRHLHNQPVTLADMGPALIRIWNNIPEVFFNTLIRSMRRRCQACINQNDEHTRY
jgi:transposase